MKLIPYSVLLIRPLNEKRFLNMDVLDIDYDDNFDIEDDGDEDDFRFSLLHAHVIKCNANK